MLTDLFVLKSCCRAHKYLFACESMYLWSALSNSFARADIIGTGRYFLTDVLFRLLGRGVCRDVFL